jgi:hypothetical protein
MTWLTTWPSAGCVPNFAEHATERQAEHHATQIVKSGVAVVATAFWSEGDEHAEDETETKESAA